MIFSALYIVHKTDTISPYFFRVLTKDLRLAKIKSAGEEGFQ